MDENYSCHKIWFHAIKGACEIRNYLPVKLKGVLTRPFDIYHHVKPDLRTLFPLLSVKCVDNVNDSKNQKKIHWKSLKCISIERTQNTISSSYTTHHWKKSNSKYIFYSKLLEVIVFDLPHDGGVFFSGYHPKAGEHFLPGLYINTIIYYIIHQHHHILHNHTFRLILSIHQG